MKDVEFVQARKALEARSKQLKMEGKSKKQTPQRLQQFNEVFNILYMEICSESWSPKKWLGRCSTYQRWWRNSTLRIFWTTELNKTCGGTSNASSLKPITLATQDGPDEGEPVFVYNVYRKKRPNSMLFAEAPFYLSINYSKDSGKCWFKTSAMGVNKLNSLIITKVNKAGLNEKRRLTNHSAWNKTLTKRTFPPLTSCSLQVNVMFNG